MKLFLISIGLWLVWLLVMPPVYAATEARDKSQAVTEENLDELIETLESETARTELIGHLLTLKEVGTEKNDVSFSLSEALNIDEASSNLADDYKQILQSSGLSSSVVSKLLLLSIIAACCFVFYWANIRLSRYLNNKAIAVRKNFDLQPNRFGLLFQTQRLAGGLIAVLVMFYTGFSLLSSPAGAVKFDDWGVILAEYAAVIVLLTLFVAIIWEGLNAALEYGMSGKSTLNSARVETLLPVIRNISFFILLLLLSLVTLSELGIDILPILAGAGVLGIAIGFGAQSMVKDFLTGFIIVLEDLVQVGDVIQVGGRTGAVEKITLRKMQIRSLEGTVHTVPHSGIDVIDNYTKEFSYYMMNVGVAYHEDTDQVISCLEAVDEDMRNSSDFADRILQPLQVLGVDEFADSAVIIKVRTKTKPHDKWVVGREFNRRIKKAFDKEGIEIPFPHRTLFLNNVASESTESEADK